MTVQGGPIIFANIGKVTRAMESRVVAGLRAAGLELQHASQAMAPVEFGNLRASAYTISRGTGWSTVIEVGYTAAYALFVHEKVGMVLRGQPRTPSPPHQGRYWDPQGRAQAKFLETPARTMGPRLLDIIRKSAGMP